MPNVHFFGEVPQSQVHRYIDAFDVAIIPFKAEGLSRYVHPLKVYDYLARFRPVVSSCLPEIQGFPGVRLAETQRQWLSALTAAASEGVDQGAVREFLQERTWAQAARRLLAAVRAGDAEGRPLGCALVGVAAAGAGD